MPEFFLELFSEEIPWASQKEAAFNLAKLIAEALAPLNPSFPRDFFGPRRIAVRTDIAASIPASTTMERGPRLSAPEQALAGFIRKYNTTKDKLVIEGDFWVFQKEQPESSARQLILDAVPKAIKRLPWRKSMRWSQGGDLSWIRPLRRIICLLDGKVVPIDLGPITASDETEGHRNDGGTFAVSSAHDWETKLFERWVRADQAKRITYIGEALPNQLAKYDLSWVEDFDLLDEVNGLVEWPAPLVGKIDEQFMDLPPEVRELSMKVNQKYFALRGADGKPAPYFAFVANLEASDGGAAIIAGNERVLRARLSDARHFWDCDVKHPLSYYLSKLENVTFHAKLGTQADRARRIASLAGTIASQLNASLAECELATNAGGLAKADLATGMVKEFPELQGIMGGYYAAKHPDRWDGTIVSEAIRTHYSPKGPNDDVPHGLVSCSVALADKLDTLIGFFQIGEKPTGSGDPYALRRAALGVIRIILENELRLSLRALLGGDGSLFTFIIERLRVKLRTDGKRFDVLDAVLAAGSDDDLVRLMKRVEALGKMLDTDDGRNLHAAYKRADNILRIEDTRDGPHTGQINASWLESEERELDHAIRMAEGPDGLFKHGIVTEDFTLAMQGLSTIRPYIEAFFENVTVNAEQPELRLNRLKLLARFRDTVHQIADFSKLEG